METQDRNSPENRKYENSTKKILHHLLKCPGGTLQNKLVRQSKIDPSVVSILIDKFEKANLLQKKSWGKTNEILPDIEKIKKLLPQLERGVSFGAATEAIEMKDKIDALRNIKPQPPLPAKLSLKKKEIEKTITLANGDAWGEPGVEEISLALDASGQGGGVDKAVAFILSCRSNGNRFNLEDLLANCGIKISGSDLKPFLAMVATLANDALTEKNKGEKIIKKIIIKTTLVETEGVAVILQ